MCGEQLSKVSPLYPIRGSPPRVRGTEQPQPVGASNQRITPACAGNSIRQIIMEKISKDHPRVCGEQ